MTAPYLGGFRILGIGWISQHGLAVAFESSWGSAYHYQLYFGRSLAGVTSSTSQRVVYGNGLAADWPEHVTVVAVTPANRLTDYGALLPERPYNRVKLTYDNTGYPANTRFMEITAGTEPGGAVDLNNVLSNELFTFAGVHSFITDPLPGSGQWNFEIAGRDQTRPDGNRGTALELSANILAHPPDVVMDPQGNRLAVSIADGEATVTFTLPD